MDSASTENLLGDCIITTERESVCVRARLCVCVCVCARARAFFLGYTHTHTHIYLFTDPSSAQVRLNDEFVMKTAKLHYASKSNNLQIT